MVTVLAFDPWFLVLGFWNIWEKLLWYVPFGLFLWYASVIIMLLVAGQVAQESAERGAATVPALCWALGCLLWPPVTILWYFRFIRPEDIAYEEQAAASWRTLPNHYSDTTWQDPAPEPSTVTRHPAATRDPWALREDPLASGADPEAPPLPEHWAEESPLEGLPTPRRRPPPNPPVEDFRPWESLGA